MLCMIGCEVVRVHLFMAECVETCADAAAVQQCWLRQGAGQAAEGPAVLVDTMQHARGGSGAGFKYQDVVRRKADRAALEVPWKTVSP